MSFRGEMKDFIEGMKAGQDYWAKRADTKYREAQYENIRQPTEEELNKQGGAPRGAGGDLSNTPQSTDTSTTGSTGGGGKPQGGDIAWKGASPEQRALLRTIASKESPGYNVMYGGKTFEGYDKHPGVDVPIQSGPNRGKTSSAAGRYQFLGSTWNRIASAYHLDNFSPENQDKAAWYLATEDYGRKTGRDLSSDLKSKDPAIIAGIGKALSGTWTSLPSGIEQGQGENQFVSTFNSFLGDATKTATADTSVSGPGGTEIGGGTPKGRRSTVQEDPNDKASKPEEVRMSATEQGQAPAIEVVDARPAQVGTPQVQTAFFTAAQPQAGGLSEPRDDEVQPTLFAAEGGAIPEPDKYNAARGYTQAIPQPAAVSTPTAATTAQATGTTTPTSYQQKFRDMRAARAQVQPAAAAAAAPVGYQQSLSDWEKKRNDWTGGQTRFSNPYQIPAMQIKAQQAAGAMPKPAEGASSGDQALYMAYQQKYKTPTNYSGMFGSGAGYGGSRREAGGMVYHNFAEGGAIPEPGEAFARGGSVKDLRSSAARGRSYRVPSGSARGESAAYTTSSPGWRQDEAADDEPYFRPRSKPLPKSGIAKITKPAPPRGGKRKGGKGGNVPTPEARPDPLVPAAGTPTEGYEPKAKAAGTPFPPEPSTFPARPEVHSDNTYPVRPQQGPPAPPRRVQPGSKGHSEPPPGSAIVDIDPRRWGDSGSGPPPAIDNGMSTIPGVRNAVPGTDVPRGGTWVDANTGQPGTPPAIPTPESPQGAWINGQWVPFNTSAVAGQGFARGGKVDKDVRSSAVKGRSYRPTFANSRADSAGYTTSSPGWRRDEEFPEAPLPAARSRPPSGGGGAGVPRETGAIPTPYPRPRPPILEDRETRWRGSDYPILEDRATRFRPNDIERGQPPAPQGVVDLPSYGSPPAPQAVVTVPQAQPAAVPNSLNVSTITTAPGVGTGPTDEELANAPRYALGGAVPDDEDQMLSPRADSAGYTSSAPGRPAASRTSVPTTPPRPAPTAEDQAPKADVEATPHLLSAVSQAVQGGARFLTKVFGLNGQGDGAVPTPESGAAREDGIRRFASNEGAMTPQEINGIDDAVDPNRELSEGDRQMNRFAQTMNWYLSRGRKEDAEAAAAGLMQYGAQRFGRLGSMSGAAYKKYLETKDPKDLEAATKFLSKAYEMVPDGAQMAITIDPDTHMLQATRVGADGEQEAYDISPGEIPGLIQQTMNQSGYWKQIFTLADPTGAHQEDAQAEARRTADVSYGRDEKKELRKHGWDIDKEQRDADLAQKKLEEQRAYTEGTETKTHERDRKEKLADDKAAEERARRQTLLSESLTRTRPDKTGKPVVNSSQVASLLDQADTVQDEINKLDLGKDDPVPPELQDKLNEALSRLYDASGQDEDLMTKLNFPKANWRYRSAAPVAGARRGKDPNTGQEGWYKPDPSRPGKFIKLTEQEAAAAS